MATLPRLIDASSAACEPIKRFEDERGTIQPIVDSQVGGCALITSKKGTVRANRYHKLDWHYCYVISGTIRYYHRSVGSTEDPKIEVFKVGSIFFSPSMVEHAMEFLEDTVFIVVSHLPRDHEDYEKDVVRVADLTKISTAY